MNEAGRDSFIVQDFKWVASIKTVVSGTAAVLVQKLLANMKLLAVNSVLALAKFSVADIVIMTYLKR